MGAKVREAKNTTETFEELRDRWLKQMEGIPLQTPSKKTVKFTVSTETPQEALANTIEHYSERSVSFSRAQIYKHVFDHLQEFTIEQLDEAIDHHPHLLSIEGNRFTTTTLLERELNIISTWQYHCKTSVSPLAQEVDLSDSELNPGQAEAVRRVLSSHNRHQIIKGLSGTGKTTAQRYIVAYADIPIYGFAPTIKAAEELEKSLGIPAQTVERLVLKGCKPGLWIIDEAGLMSARQMQAVLNLADETGSRIVLVGDTGQNSAVEAGSPMASLMTHGAETHQISQIIRQQNREQKRAVELLAQGNGAEAISYLNEHGYISEVPNHRKRATQVTQTYLKKLERYKDPSKLIVVAGTNAEKDRLTKRLRSALKDKGMLRESVEAYRLVSRGWTRQQMSDGRNYQAGDYVRFGFTPKGCGLRSGGLYRVEDIEDGVLVLRSHGGRLHRVHPQALRPQQVYFAVPTDYAVGDRVIFRSTDKRRGQTNGKQLEITAINERVLTGKDKDGLIQKISISRPVALDHAWVGTSYRWQGSTATDAIVSLTSDPTSGRNSTYVAVSRQTKHLTVVTEDLDRLYDWADVDNRQANVLEQVRPESKAVSEAVEQWQQTGDISELQSAISPPIPEPVPFWQPDYSQVECPTDINPKHWQEMQASAIHPDLAAANIVSIEGNSVYERLIGDRLAQMGSGQFVTKPQRRLMDRYEDPAQGGWWAKASPNSTWGCFKADTPRWDERNRKPIKYEHPLGRERELYLPEVPEDLKDKILAKYGVEPKPDETLYEIAIRENLPIVVTEGYKKTLASLSQGYITVGISGVNALYRAKDEDQYKLPERQLNSAFLPFCTPGRQITFAYDQDTKLSAILNVRRDMVRTIELIEPLGPEVRVAAWDTDEGKGLDDLIAGVGPVAYDQAIVQAEPADRAERTHYRTLYNRLAKATRELHPEWTPTQVDMAVYKVAVLKGDNHDGDRVISQSDAARDGAGPDYPAQIKAAALKLHRQQQRQAQRQREQELSL